MRSTGTIQSLNFKNMKYYYGHLKIEYQGFVFDEKLAFELQDNDDIHLFGNHLAKTFYNKKGRPVKNSSSTYSYDSGKMIVSVSKITEVTKKEYQIIAKFLHS